MKILILGLGAFGFAIGKYLGENNPDKKIYAGEVNPEIFKSIQENRTHPYFFPGILLPENIELIKNTKEILPEIDVIISIIPCQFIGNAFEGIKDSLKSGVTILNLAKGINNKTLQTTSEKLTEVLGDFSYTYAYLAGGMIAKELVNGKKLGADIVTQNKDIGKYIHILFQSENLDINLIIGETKPIELFAALKNIIALILGYYEGKGNGASTLGYYLTKLLKEVSLLGENEKIQGELSGKDKRRCPRVDFTSYAVCGDIIATCFGGSRNRLLGNMLGEGKSIEEALEKLKSQNKIAEGYETLKGMYTLTKGKKEFELINDFAKRYLIDII